MRAMCPKRPAKHRWGIHRANILPPRGAFAVRSPQIMRGARILPSSGGPAPAHGLLPEQPHRGIAFQRLGPCPGVPAPSASPIPATRRYPPPANTRHLPMPATRQYLPLAVPVAARDKPPMSFGGDHPAHGLQSGQAPRGRRPHHLDGQADNGMLRRTGPGFQNREQVGAEPPAEAAGPAGPAPALPKTPIERTSPSWRNYRSTPKNSYQSCFLRLPLAEFAPVAVSPTVPQLRQEFSQHKRHAGFLGLPFDQFAPVVLTVVPVGITAPMPRRAFLGCISPVRARAVRDLLVLLRLLRLPALRLATRIEMMAQSIA